MEIQPIGARTTSTHNASQDTVHFSTRKGRTTSHTALVYLLPITRCMIPEEGQHFKSKMPWKRSAPYFLQEMCSESYATMEHLPEKCW
ncbi:hypothetical protein TNCT_259661 [Trichonephila clavata]|uniref:Uncharacterized protein n=1 Tax=Trichonephila clavata TaxID=2740835 RepID=A0A8X6J276_TRICU|nr:hypothetical protein TNCT_259661 [Trichonephila clavata]